MANFISFISVDAGQAQENLSAVDKERIKRDRHNKIEKQGRERRKIERKSCAERMVRSEEDSSKSDALIEELHSFLSENNVLVSEELKDRIESCKDDYKTYQEWVSDSSNKAEHQHALGRSSLSMHSLMRCAREKVAEESSSEYNAINLSEINSAGPPYKRQRINPEPENPENALLFPKFKAFLLSQHTQLFKAFLLSPQSQLINRPISSQSVPPASRESVSTSSSSSSSSHQNQYESVSSVPSNLEFSRVESSGRNFNFLYPTLPNIVTESPQSNSSSSIRENPSTTFASSPSNVLNNSYETFWDMQPSIHKVETHGHSGW